MLLVEMCFPIYLNTGLMERGLNSLPEMCQEFNLLGVLTLRKCLSLMNTFLVIWKSNHIIPFCQLAEKPTRVHTFQHQRLLKP